MNYFIRISNEVYEEIEKVSYEYEVARTGYGELFEDRLFEMLRALEKNPFHGRKEIIEGIEFRVVPFPHRKPRFPYLIIYEILEKQKQVDIIQIVHSSSNWLK